MRTRFIKGNLPKSKDIMREINKRNTPRKKEEKRKKRKKF